MSEEGKKEKLLEPYRALDLTDEKGLLCGKLLADMGVDVIKIENPSGDPARRIGPFFHDDPHPEKSLYWFAYNTNKKGITLNIETTDGQQIFKQLVKTSDIIIESFDPGYLDSLGLGYNDLEKINPEVILVSITPFGQSGPYVDQGFKVNDMIVWALGGAMSISGDHDRPPNQISFPHAYLHGGAEGAQGAMMALYARSLNGEGQHVDVSIQECMSLCTMNTLQFWDMYKINLPRGVYKRGIPRADGIIIKNPVFWPCKDGWVFLGISGGVLRSFIYSSEALVKWMDEVGMAGDIKDYDWWSFDSSTITQEEVDKLWSYIAPFLLEHTKAELYEEAIKRKILIAPMNNPKDIAESPQLHSRDFFVQINHPELGESLTYCGPWVNLSETPLREWSKAPLIGEHNYKIYEKELKFTKEQIMSLKQASII